MNNNDNINQLKTIKDNIDFIDAIKEIDEELNNDKHDKNKLNEINIKAKNRFPMETSQFEIANSMYSKSPIVPLNEANIETLLSRLPFYRDLYIKELITKGKD